jgi:N-acetylneuraminic acid mutarotase
MAEPPGSVAPQASAVWAGDRIVVWGGTSAKGVPLATGASYDPRRDSWTDLPPAPLAAGQGHNIVWTGSEVLFWGKGPGAALDPVKGTWRTIPDAPIPGRTGHVAVWTGKEMVVWGGHAQCCPIDSVIHEPVAAAFDPVKNTWRRLADVPAPWSGDGGPAVVAVDDQGRMLVYRGERLGRFDPTTNSWVTLAAEIPPEKPVGELGCAMTGGPALVGASVDSRLFIWTGGCAPTRGLSHALGEGTGWSEIAGSELNGTGAWAVAGDHDVFLGGAVPTGVDVYRYDPAADRMDKLDHPGLDIAPFATALWSGTELFVFNGNRGIGQPRPGAIWGNRAPTP